VEITYLHERVSMQRLLSVGPCVEYNGCQCTIPFNSHCLGRLHVEVLVDKDVADRLESHPFAFALVLFLAGSTIPFGCEIHPLNGTVQADTRLQKQVVLLALAHRVGGDQTSRRVSQSAMAQRGDL
jgi:hypothetical protein